MRRDEESVVLLETFDYRAFIGKHVLFSLNIEPELKGRITIGMNKFLFIRFATSIQKSG